MKESHFAIMYSSLFQVQFKNLFLQLRISLKVYFLKLIFLIQRRFDKVETRSPRSITSLIFLSLLNLILVQNISAQVTPDYVQADSYSAAVSSVTVNMPASSAIGDLVLIYIVTDDDGDITNPGEFTELFDFAAGTAGPQSGLFYRAIDGTESATYNFSFPSEPAVVTTLRYKNINTVTPFDVTGNGFGTSATPQAPSVTTTQNDRTILQFIGVDGASAGVLASSSSTSTILAAAESGPTAGAEMMIVSELQAAAGATPVGNFTFANEQWTGITIALNTFNIKTTGLSGISCAAGMSSFSFDFALETSSGMVELVDPVGNVVDTKSYSSATGSETFNFTPSQTGEYTIRDQANTTISTTELFYIDSDGDSVCDDVDIDDDNDGIQDNVESPNCFFTLADFPFESGDRTNTISVSTEWTVNNGDLINILNGNTADNAVRKTNGDFTFSGQEFLHFTLPEALTFDEVTLHHEGTAFLDAELGGIVQGSNDGMVWTDLTTSGTILPDAASPHTINLTQNLEDYSHYRIYVTSGTIDDDEYLREVEFSMIFDPIDYPKPSCDDDIDGDLVYNHLDLDSDGDTCSDALEAGATMDVTADFQFPIGGSGANGLPDAVETMAESGIINYVSTYDPEAIINTLTACIDSDGDSVVDGNDDDIDNDGIPNSVEDGYCNLDYNLAANKTQIQISSNTGLGGTGGIVALLNGDTGENTFWYTNSAWTGDEIVRLEFPFPTILTGLEYWIGNDHMQDYGTVTKIQGSNDGTDWVDMTPNAEFTMVAPDNTPGVLSAAPNAHTFLWTNDTPYLYYRQLGVSGGGNPTPFVNELFFQTESPSVCDFDGDGFPNSKDLDSDGDGIPDNVEAQTTAGYVAPASDNQITYASNSGLNTAYLAGLPIPDTNTDGIPDFLDVDSDSDRISDSDESGLPLTGIIESNGLDMGVATSGDYSDVNGIVDNPSTDLASITTLTSEVDYRDKQPPPQITVCYNNESYGIGGSNMTFHDDKLLNPANFGEFGLAYYDMVLKNLGDGQTITSVQLIAEGCQIFFMGGTNGEAGSFTSTSSFSTTALDALRDWAESPNNVMIAFQGHAISMGGTELVEGVPTNKFAGTNNNNNPNTLTELGENVISGVFGQTGSFNQGGSFQGHFTTFPSSACAITQDGSAMPLPTGLINGDTGDFYFGDFGLVDETSDISNSANITTNNDRLFGNLMASAAMVAIEGPDDVCSFFLCPAGDVAPSLTSTDVSSAGLPVDLTTLYTGTPPVGSLLTWHNASPVADENYIGNASNFTQSGIVYAAFRAEDGSCYSPFTPVMVTVNYPDLEVTISPGDETSSTGEVQSFTVMVTNNGPIAAPDAIVKVPIPADRQLILANPSLGTYSGSTFLWNVGELVNGQSATLDITIRL